MTALKEYARLETMGRWRPAPGAAPQGVAVLFGDATLVLLDDGGRALSHWSLPAVLRLNPGDRPALYAPDEEGTETLEIDDDLMTAAIERVRSSVARRRGGLSGVRRAALGAVAAALVAGAVLWLPGALRREALAVVPPAKRSEIGATLLGHVQRVAGTACRDPVGAAALERLRRRTLGQAAPGQAVVLPDGPAMPLVLPGDIVVLPRAAVEAAAEPAVLAGHLLAAAAAGGGGDGEDRLVPLLDAAGVWATLRLLVTGEVGEEALAAYAAGLLATPAPPPGPAALAPAFAAAEVPIGPYARATDPAGADAAVAVAADPYARGAPLVLTDAEWVGLQGICRA